MNRLKENYIKGIYKKIVVFLTLIHISYLFIFSSLSLTAPAIYDIFSICFYIFMMVAVSKGCYRFAVMAVHIEVALFATVCTLAGLAGMNMKLYLIAMASIVYFCPYRHKWVPYVFAIGEIGLYVLLELYEHFCVDALALQGMTALFLKLYNACVCFGAILVSAFLTDVSASVTRKRLTDENRALTRLANYDQLTGLQSRHLFLKRVGGSRSEAEMVICIGDIDDFKNINDTYGHIFGDYVLQKIAEIMRRVFDTDHVDICRWGGEEFLLMFYNISFQEAYEKAEELRKTVSEYKFCFENKSINVTMTFGMYKKTGDEEIKELLEEADKLLYQGKLDGKNIVVKKGVEE